MGLVKGFVITAIFALVAIYLYNRFSDGGVSTLGKK